MPPAPITITVSPGSTWATLTVEPQPVLTAQPTRQARSKGISGSILTADSTPTVEYSLKQSDAIEGNLVPRFWAGQKIADLSSDAEKNADELSDVGREFCLVTPNWQCRLPGYEYRGNDPYGFMLRDEIVDYIEGFAASFDPPLRCGVSVLRVHQE